MTSSVVRLAWLTSIVPLAVGLRYLTPLPPLAAFVLGGLAVAVLAIWMRRATDQIAKRAGSAIGGLLNVSFGSAAELILMLFVVMAGHPDVVRAQITGSIIGTSLLGLGLACLVGGLTRDQQAFSQRRTGLLASLFLIVVFALMLPAVFDDSGLGRALSSRQRLASEEALSLGVAVVLLLLYGGNLVYTLITHRDVFASANPKEAPANEASWGLASSVAVLVGATATVAVCAGIVSGALEGSAETLHLPLLFLGVVPLALVGTAADLFASVVFARQNRMDLVLAISIGSAIQVGLVIAPLLVLISWAMGRPMTLVFPNTLNLFAITGAAFIVRAITADGDSSWFEGLLLIGVYVLLALAFFFIAPG
jgi:Ca2+:H+ antiporter